jgi:hypothetical protein
MNELALANQATGELDSWETRSAGHGFRNVNVGHSTAAVLHRSPVILYRATSVTDC